MKIKMICGSIVVAAAVGSATSAIAQQVNLDGSVSGRIVRTYTGQGAKPYIAGSVAQFQAMLTSPDAARRAMAQKSLDDFKAGNVQNFIHQTSSPINGPATLAGPIANDAPPQPGSINVSQWCTTSSGYIFAHQIVQTWEPISPGSSTYGWVTTTNKEWQVTVCPTTV